MIKTFFKNSFIYSIGVILTRGIGILLIPIYTRYLSPSEYGVIDLFVILTTVITILISLEIHQAVVRFYQDTNNLKDKIEYVSSAFIFSLFIYISYFIVSISFSDFFTKLLLDDIKYESVFLLGSASIASAGIFYFVSGQLKWQMLAKESVIVSIIHILITAAIAIYLLIIEDMKIESIFIGQISGNIVGTFLSIYFAKESYQLLFRFSKFKQLISFSYPLVFSSISISISLYIDRIAIKDLLGLESLGIYALAYKFAMITGLVMVGFQSSLSPLIYKYYKEKETPNNISKLFNGFAIFSLFIIAGSILFSKEVVVFMSTKEFYGASILIAPLVMSVFFSKLYIFTPGLDIAKKTKIVAGISFFGALINVILNYTLIPIFGLIGAALATLIGSITVFSIYVKLSNKYYKIIYNWSKKVVMLLLILILSYYVNSLFEQISFFSISIKSITILFLFSIMVYFLSGVENIQKFKDVIINKFK